MTLPLPARTDQPCVAHAQVTTQRCATNAQYNELHHVIPQAWQNAWLEGEKLFDPRTVPLCPTGHRNVHFWLVALMHALPATVLDVNTTASDRSAVMAADDAVHLTAKREGRRVNRKEFACAREALIRWVESGKSLGWLATRKLWGQA